MAKAKKAREAAKSAPKTAAKEKAASVTKSGARAKTGGAAARSAGGAAKAAKPAKTPPEKKSAAKTQRKSSPTAEPRSKAARNQSAIDKSAILDEPRAASGAKPEKAAKNAQKAAGNSKSTSNIKSRAKAKTGAKTERSESGAAQTGSKAEQARVKAEQNQSEIDSSGNAGAERGGSLDDAFAMLEAAEAANVPLPPGFGLAPDIPVAASGSVNNNESDSEAQIIYSLNPAAKIYVKTAAVVKAIGRSTAWVRELATRNIFDEEQTAHGTLFELISTIRAYIEYLGSGDNDEEKSADLQKKQEDARYKKYKADIAEMQVKELQGKLHRSEDVQKMTGDLLYYVRGSLLALAGRCATDCAASSNPAEIQKIIEREVFAILRELAEYKYNPERYDELVRQRTKREIDELAEDDDSE